MIVIEAVHIQNHDSKPQASWHVSQLAKRYWVLLCYITCERNKCGKTSVLQKAPFTLIHLTVKLADSH